MAETGEFKEYSPLQEEREPIYVWLEKNSEHVPFLLKKTVTQIHLETDVKIKNELPIVVGLSQVLPKSRASLFGLFGRYWMLFILSMDNNRFVH